jgi:transcriptional regulator with XRE-family HTH domain
MNKPHSKIRSLRTAMGMSRETFAALLGVSVAWLAQVEREPAFMTEELARRAARKLHVRPDDLLGARGTPSPRRRRIL